MSLLPISDSGPMKAELAKQMGQNQVKEGTNLKVTPSSEQAIHGNPYGKDGMLLTGEKYNALSTILPNSELEKSRKELKKEQKKKKKDKEKKKKKSFWEWLLEK